MQNQWYVATLIIRCRVDDQHPVTHWTCDEQIRLIAASDDETAYTKAMALGEAENHHYANVDGKLVYWEFMGIEELQPLDALTDGLEVRSRLFGHPDPTALVRTKAELGGETGELQVAAYRYANDDVD